ncbi:hypothetical protein DFQ30_007405 [Apophysomyces sp. BC1015]|nr:hypothetical protein DFQ30_007405 [Apophysomyces sp. BC1015]
MDGCGWAYLGIERREHTTLVGRSTKCGSELLKAGGHWKWPLSFLQAAKRDLMGAARLQKRDKMAIDNKPDLADTLL